MEECREVVADERWGRWRWEVVVEGRGGGQWWEAEVAGGGGRCRWRKNEYIMALEAVETAQVLL